MKTFKHKDTLTIRELYSRIVREKLGRELLGLHIEDTVKNFRCQGFTNRFYGLTSKSMVQAQIVAVEGCDKVRFDHKSINILYMFDNSVYQGHSGDSTARHQISHPNSTACWWANVYIPKNDDWLVPNYGEEIEDEDV